MTSATALRSLALALTLWSFVPSAAAAPFPVRGTILRPAYFVSLADPPVDCRDAGAVCLREKDMRHGSQTIFVPASSQRVAVYMPVRNDLLRSTQLCGVFYTNSRGELNGNADCGGPMPFELFLEVQGVSARGFVVGTFNEDLFWTAATFISLSVAPVLTMAIPAIASGGGSLVTALIGAGVAPLPIVQLLKEGPDIFAWYSRIHYRVGPNIASMDFGTFPIGGSPPAPGRTVSNNTWAAAVFEGVDFTYRSLPLSPAPRSNWIVNNYLFGAPTTIWGTVHINQAGGWDQAMGAIVHEMGHVAYNVRHSDELHYWGEVLEYASNHGDCGTRRGARFAQYEGFATAVSDAVWTNQEARYRDATGESGPASYYPSPANECESRGFAQGLTDEGNVADLYAAAVSGIDDGLLLPLGDSTRAGGVGLERYTLLPLRSLFEMVSESGSGAHSVLQTWPALSAKCSAATPTRALCASERFRCFVRSRLANPGELPGTFWSDDCRPDASRVIASEPGQLTRDLTEVRVELERVPYAQVYRVWVSDTPGGAAESVDVPGPSLTARVAIDACRPSYARVETRAIPGPGLTATSTLGPEVELSAAFNPYQPCEPGPPQQAPIPLPFP